MSNFLYEKRKGSFVKKKEPFLNFMIETVVTIL